MTLEQIYSLATRRLSEAQQENASISVLTQLEAEFNTARTNVLAGNKSSFRRGDVEGAILARQEAEGGEVFCF